LNKATKAAFVNEPKWAKQQQQKIGLERKKRKKNFSLTGTGRLTQTNIFIFLALSK
jgi:hypothetical protein